VAKVSKRAESERRIANIFSKNFNILRGNLH
jgi:hypothetical protein